MVLLMLVRLKSYIHKHFIINNCVQNFPEDKDDDGDGIDDNEDKDDDCDGKIKCYF